MLTLVKIVLNSKGAMKFVVLYCNFKKWHKLLNFCRVSVVFDKNNILPEVFFDDKSRVHKTTKKTVQVKCAGVFLRIKLKGIYWIVKSKESLLSTVLNCKSKGPVLRKRVATCWLNLPLFEGDRKSTKTLKTWLEVACLIKVPFLEASELLLWKGVWIS